jgi:hypothetical protein
MAKHKENHESAYEEKHEKHKKHASHDMHYPKNYDKKSSSCKMAHKAKICSRGK